MTYCFDKEKGHNSLFILNPVLTKSGHVAYIQYCYTKNKSVLVLDFRFRTVHFHL